MDYGRETSLGGDIDFESFNQSRSFRFSRLFGAGINRWRRRLFASAQLGIFRNVASSSKREIHFFNPLKIGEIYLSMKVKEEKNCISTSYKGRMVRTIETRWRREGVFKNPTKHNSVSAINLATGLDGRRKKEGGR